MSREKILVAFPGKTSLFAALIMVLGFGCSPSSTSGEQESLVHVLDDELNATDHETAHAGFNDAVKTARLAVIEVEALRKQLKAGFLIKFALPGDDQAVLAIDAVQDVLPEVTTFSGHLAEDEFADFIFSMEDGKLVGSIRRRTQAWLVESHSGTNLHMIRLLERTMLPKDEVLIEAAQTPERAAPSPPATSLLAGGNVRVLFLYANNIVNAAAQASNIATAFNNSLSDSLVSSSNKITIAGVQPVASSFDGMSRLAIRAAMNSRMVPFSNIDTLMANAYADVAFLLVQEDPTASSDVPGYGRVGGIAGDIYESSLPFALSTDDYALGDLTALHELGHVFGGRHENDPSGGSAHPVVSPDDTWMTIMGGYIECPFKGLPASCVRISRWSNPALSYRGVPLGVAGHSDMRSWLESSMPVVSAWREEPPLPTVTVYSNSFETSSDLSGWQIWHNCASSGWTPASNVFRYYTASDSPAPGGGAYALRMQTTGFSPGCIYPGAYAASPAIGAIAGTTYKIDNMSRNSAQPGEVSLMFFDSSGSVIGFASQAWTADTWMYNADPQLVATAPSGTTSLRVRYGLRTPNGVADLDLLRVTR